MPELPEVETVRRQLATALPGWEIEAVERMDPFMLAEPGAAEFAAALPGRRVVDVSRRGKFLLIELSGGFWLTVHLGMTGQLLFSREAAEPPAKHDRYVLRLAWPAGRGVVSSSGAGAPVVTAEAHSDAADPPEAPGFLIFRDMRKFGRVHLTTGGPAARIHGMGPDAWPGDAWAPADLTAMLRGRTAPLKAFLLDQRRLAGIGNIYADEILFGARLSPLRPAGSLSPREVRRLAEQIRQRLDDGVRLRGCSISDYVDAGGRTGSFQNDLRAYGRHGKPCVTCGRPLVRVVVAGRGTAYCPTCQR